MIVSGKVLAKLSALASAKHPERLFGSRRTSDFLRDNSFTVGGTARNDTPADFNIALRAVLCEARITLIMNGHPRIFGLKNCGKVCGNAPSPISLEFLVILSTGLSLNEFKVTACGKSRFVEKSGKDDHISYNSMILNAFSNLSKFPYFFD